MRVKTAAVAGSFYPAEAEALRALVNQLLMDNPNTGPCPVALQVPHAGLRFSGAVAATAYNRVRSYASQFKRIVLLGPAHRVGTDKMVTIAADTWRTPLGMIGLDKTLADSLCQQGLLEYDNHVHAQEHCIEVQLPFIQAIGLGHLPLLPIIVGQLDQYTVAKLIDYILSLEGSLVLISSDLSHFHQQAQAQTIDGQTIRQIEALEPPINPQQACGCYPLNGFLHYAKQHRLSAEKLAQATSADAGADPKRVVGYSAFAFYRGSNTKLGPQFTPEEQQALIHLAKQAIGREFELNAGKTLHFSKLDQQAACFVTLNINGRLRGCIGNLEARDSLANSIQRNAKLAAFNDHRFKPLSVDEFKKIDIELSILSPMQPLAATDEADLLAKIRPGVDGLVFRAGKKQATFLPSVWAQLPQPQQFLLHLKRKAGIADEYWGNDVCCFIYQSVKVSEITINT